MLRMLVIIPIYYDRFMFVVPKTNLRSHILLVEGTNGRMALIGSFLFKMLCVYLRYLKIYDSFLIIFPFEILIFLMLLSSHIIG